MNIDMNGNINRYTVDDAAITVLEWTDLNIEIFDN